MSSAIMLSFKTPINREHFDAWAAKNGVQYSERTIGQKTFYVDQVQIQLDQTDDMIKGATVSSYFMTNLDQIKKVASLLCSAGATITHYDQELL